MKIVFTASGTVGDILPFLSLGMAWVKRIWNAEMFEENILYYFDIFEDKLRIGSFALLGPIQSSLWMKQFIAQILSVTYPFYLFRNRWKNVTPKDASFKIKGDTVIENDVWIEYR